MFVLENSSYIAVLSTFSSSHTIVQHHQSNVAHIQSLQYGKYRKCCPTTTNKQSATCILLFSSSSIFDSRMSGVGVS